MSSNKKLAPNLKKKPLIQAAAGTQKNYYPYIS
jgi:hypothetical protein